MNSHIREFPIYRIFCGYIIISCANCCCGVSLFLIPAWYGPCRNDSRRLVVIWVIVEVLGHKEKEKKDWQVGGAQDDFFFKTQVWGPRLCNAVAHWEDDIWPQTRNAIRLQSRQLFLK